MQAMCLFAGYAIANIGFFVLLAGGIDAGTVAALGGVALASMSVLFNQR